jgi:8-oxo-dGTP diphosphatase
MREKRFMVRSAVYLILLKKNKILLLRRFNTGWMDGKYSLIAGHINGNESVSDAMIREAVEEAGIEITKKDIKPATVIHRKSKDSEYMDFFFVCNRWNGEPVNKEPHRSDGLSWFPIGKLPANLLPFIKQAIENYQNKIPFSEFGW